VRSLIETKFNIFNSLPIEQYGYLLKHAACIVGNSSSGIRESCIFGTPNVSVGKRQDNREHGGNSVFVEAERNQIVGAVKAQMVLGHTEPIYTYGDGTASEKILEVIKEI
ncbi:MAG TPA: UDP-N-acetylglucosamine 2-epimerase (hydrolyzing), partial [bacterium]|nr:UDP-N-acetylglucosamine 2-epimerase (hydrolyzing) [bacterium]